MHTRGQYLFRVVGEPLLVHLAELRLVGLELLLDLRQLLGVRLQLRVLLRNVQVRQARPLHARLLHAHKDGTGTQHHDG